MHGKSINMITVKENIINPVDWIDPFTRERYKQFSKYLNDGLTVLDFGCHRGIGGALIKDLFPATKLYGVELSKDAVSLIPGGIYEEVFNHSILDVNDNLKFDRIVAGEVIEHIPREDFKLVLDKCMRLLNKNGLLILTTPNPDCYLVKMGRDQVLKEPSHVNILSIEEFKSIIKSSGLTLCSITGSGKASRYFGTNFPLINVYGSYLAVLKKK